MKSKKGIKMIRKIAHIGAMMVLASGAVYAQSAADAPAKPAAPATVTPTTVTPATAAAAAAAAAAIAAPGRAQAAPAALVKSTVDEVLRPVGFGFGTGAKGRLYEPWSK